MSDGGAPHTYGFTPLFQQVAGGCVQRIAPGDGRATRDVMNSGVTAFVVASMSTFIIRSMLANQSLWISIRATRKLAEFQCVAFPVNCSRPTGTEPETMSCRLSSVARVVRLR